MSRTQPPPHTPSKHKNLRLRGGEKKKKPLSSQGTHALLLVTTDTGRQSGFTGKGRRIERGGHNGRGDNSAGRGGVSFPEEAAQVTAHWRCCSRANPFNSSGGRRRSRWLAPPPAAPGSCAGGGLLLGLRLRLGSAACALQRRRRRGWWGGPRLLHEVVRGLGRRVLLEPLGLFLHALLDLQYCC